MGCREAGLILALLLAAPAPAGAQVEPGWSKEDKALALNLGLGVATLGLGIWNWDWGRQGPRFQDEGWFGRETGEGGADKLGHLWTSYALSHLLAGQYERFGYGEGDAARLGALSSLGAMTLVEVGDAFTDRYGFSYQDMLFDAIGAAAGYLLWRDRALARKVDLRVEYDPFAGGMHRADVFTDYDRLRYLVAIKAEGFGAITHPALSLLELHLGYHARNYDDTPGGPDRRERHLYVGIGLNLRSLLGDAPGAALLSYVQPPYAYLPLDGRFD